MTAYLTGWLNTGLLLLDVFIIAILLPTVVQQRRESGATLAWVLVIVLLPFIGLLSFWVFGTTRLYFRRRKRRKVEAKPSNFSAIHFSMCNGFRCCSHMYDQ